MGSSGNQLKMVWTDYLTVTVLLCLTFIDQCLGIGCFTCSSVNGSDPGCHDPFNSSNAFYDKNCWQGKKDRDGVFNAHYCIKMSGTSRNQENMTVVVRTCAIEGMGYQCGIFKFDSEVYDGCLTTCNLNACNGARSLGRDPGSKLFMMGSTTLSLSLYYSTTAFLWVMGTRALDSIVH